MVKTKKKLALAELEHVAKLADLPLSEEELVALAPQLEAIVDFVSKLQTLPTGKVSPTAQVTRQTNKWREDVIDESRVLTQEQALANAHESHNGFFKVPGIFKE